VLGWIAWLSGNRNKLRFLLALITFSGILIGFFSSRSKQSLREANRGNKNGEEENKEWALRTRSRDDRAPERPT
jgi:hypothetical protein